MGWNAPFLLISFFIPTFVPLSSALAYNVDWKKRANDGSNNKSSRFHATGILYKKSILSKQEYDIVKNDIVNISLLPEQASIAQNRIGAVAPKRTQEIFENGSVSRLVQNIMGDDYVLSNDIPVEVCCSSNENSSC